MTRLILRHGRVIDPASALDMTADLVIENGIVHDIVEAATTDTATKVIDVSGLIVCPGWIDAHVHLRDPGQTHKEDLNSGAAAAVAGGFTRLCCMPNTNPPLDTPEAIRDIVTRGAASGVHVHPIGTISIGRAGDELAPLAAMAEAGAVGFSDDGDSTRSVEVMREALRLSSELNLPVMVHCEDPALAKPGAMHRGSVSIELGDVGIPAEAEESFIERDLLLAEETGGWLHVLHVSTDRGAEMIHRARQRGVRVTSEVMPHHLALTDEWVAGRKRFAGEPNPVAITSMDTNAKVNPPLRPESDALGLLRRLVAGEFDFVATDHAPHAPQDKTENLSSSAFGMSGLELALPTMARLVDRGEFNWPDVVAWFTSRPAATLNLPGGTLESGVSADVTVIDPQREWTISPDTLRTRSKNTPLLGLRLRGRAVLTIVGGKVVHDELS